MNLTDILFEQLSELQSEELKADTAYQSARAAKIAAERELIASMQPKQRRLFHSYMEQANYVDALELRRFFSHCTLLFMPPAK